MEGTSVEDALLLRDGARVLIKPGAVELRRGRETVGLLRRPHPRRLSFR